MCQILFESYSSTLDIQDTRTLIDEAINMKNQNFQHQLGENNLALATKIIMIINDYYMIEKVRQSSYCIPKHRAIWCYVNLVFNNICLYPPGVQGQYEEKG